MGSVSGKMAYEFKNKGRVEKAVATKVDVVSSEEVKKSVAEEVKVQDPPDAAEVVAKAKAEAEASKAKAKAKAEAEAKKLEEEKEKEKAKEKEKTDGGTEDSAVPEENSEKPK